MGCCKGISQCILLLTNSLIFVIAAGALGLSVYIFNDAVASSLTKVNFLSGLAIVSGVLMMFAILGCKTACNPPEKKCSKCLYLTILLVLFLVEFIAAGYVSNLGHAIEVAKQKVDAKVHIDAKVNKAAEDTLVFLHDQLEDLYRAESCKGGGADNSGSQYSKPFDFSTVHCKTKKASDAFVILFKDASIDSKQEFDAYSKCTQDTKFSIRSKDFTESFCGSESHILKIAHQYSRYLVWFPVTLAALTFLLLIATICVIAQKNNERRRVILVQRGEEPLRRVQMAGP